MVSTVGDALNLRSTTLPRKFEHDRLVNWATNPAHALVSAAPTLASHLVALATHANVFTPDEVSVTHSAGTLAATAHGVTLAWRPSDRPCRSPG